MDMKRSPRWITLHCALLVLVGFGKSLELFRGAVFCAKMMLYEIWVRGKEKIEPQGERA